ncbi:MAG: phenylalanine--tRNA ligase subunit beta [Campylobacterota bacterium]|nr:phenylalanine--tRNA ligase subunit beta [Campylobacterota bacterium]
MIVTKSWLNEWIDIADVSTEDLCKTFNSIGLEVDSVESYKTPQKIVVGEVIECERHRDADKLNVCKVDVGGGIRQIVCGASNVRAGIKVAVATIGAKMPGGLEIKPVQLRGVDSEGMICSSTEIGLPKLEDGIMILDESLGALELGSELCKNPYFNDDKIEIELTANRGDCLSIYGVARDLCAAYDRELRTLVIDHDKEGRIGIGRVAQLMHNDTFDANLSFRAVDIENLVLPARVALRLAQLEESYSSDIAGLLTYATHSTGVILRAYNRSCFKTQENKIEIELKNEKDFSTVLCAKGKASTVGVIQEESTCIVDNQAEVLIEASYIAPDIISRKMARSKQKSDAFFYRTSRGSEPELDLGLSYFFKILKSCATTSIYAGSLDCTQLFKPLHVSVSASSINAFIGTEIDKTTITQILKNLGFGVESSKSDYLAVKVPQYRHDVTNQQDLVEEIVRLIGIDNIPSKPFIVSEAFRFNDDYYEYQKRRNYRYKAAYSGFYESVHFVFGEREKFESFGFTCTDKDKELLNPIVNTMDTLRPSLTLGLLEAASLNAKSGQKKIALFEIGSIFDSQRNESLSMAFIFSGDKENASVNNAGRPNSIDFPLFAEKISQVIGDFELEKSADTHGLMHPYQAATVKQNAMTIGKIYKLHPVVQESYDLEETFICEINFLALDYSLKIAKTYSKYQASFRDLSVVLPDSITYEELAKVIQRYKSDEIIRFYPVDRYQDASLGENSSLSLRFVLQSADKTLGEEDITSSMSGIIEGMNSELGVELR